MRWFRRRTGLFLHRFLANVVVGFVVGLLLITSENDQNDHDDCEEKLQRGVHRRNETLSRFAGFIHYSIVQQGSSYESLQVMLDTWAGRSGVHADLFVQDNRHPRFLDDLTQPKKKFAQHVVMQSGGTQVERDFMVIKFLHYNYLEKFKWFVWLRDPTYVNANKLEKLLARADPLKPYYIGRPMSYTYLPTSQQISFCMAHSGFVLSKKLLQLIGPRLENCLREAVSFQSDVELGKCIQKWIGTQCSNALDTEDIFVLDGALSDQRKRKGIIFHVSRLPERMSLLHSKFLKDDIEVLVKKITMLEEEIRATLAATDGEELDIKGWNIGSDAIWDFLDWDSHITSIYGSSLQMFSYLKDSMTRDAYGTLEKIREKFSILKNAEIDNISVMATRFFVGPSTSIDFIPKLRIKAKLDSKPIAIRLNNLYYRKRLVDTVAFFAEDVTIHENLVTLKPVPKGEERINFIVPLSGRLQNFIRFIKNFKENFLLFSENVTLTVVYFDSHHFRSDEVIDMDSDPFQESKETEFIRKKLQNLKREFSKAEMTLIPVRSNVPFSRGLALQMGAERVDHSDSWEELLFFCDVDLVFERSILNRIRRNTISGKQAYFPVFFSQYDPDKYSSNERSTFEISEQTGFWRTFSEGMVAIYKSDFQKTGGFDLNIQGWGLEDERFCDSAVKKAKLDIFRSNDPSMVHIYHKKECSTELRRGQRRRCRNSRAQHFGSQSHLYFLWHSRRTLRRKKPR